MIGVKQQRQDSNQRFLTRQETGVHAIQAVTVEDLETRFGRAVTDAGKGTGG